LELDPITDPGSFGVRAGMLDHVRAHINPDQFPTFRLEL
jgi:hypothetical protein